MKTVLSILILTVSSLYSVIAAPLYSTMAFAVILRKEDPQENSISSTFEFLLPALILIIAFLFGYIIRNKNHSKIPYLLISILPFILIISSIIILIGEA